MPNAQCPMPNAQCPMPNAQCPMPNAQCPTSPSDLKPIAKTGEQAEEQRLSPLHHRPVGVAGVAP